MAEQVQSKGRFDFLSLPPELRNEIYFLVFGATDLLVTYHYQRTGLGKAIARRRNARDLDHASDNFLNSALAVTNHQIYYETFGMLYKQPLHFDDAAALHSFLLTIGKEHRGMLTDITLHNWTFGHPLNYVALALLAEAKDLTRLRLQCDKCTGSGIVASCAAQSACWDFGKCVLGVGLGSEWEDSNFVTERQEDDKCFCYSRTWVLRG